MNQISLRFSRWLLTMGSLAFAMSLIAGPILWYQDSRQPRPNSSKAKNDQTGPTADQQKMNPADRALTQKNSKSDPSRQKSLHLRAEY